MKILVTGSEGSLMQAVIPKLLAQGHEITGVDNLYRYGKASELADRDYKLIRQDLSERDLDLCQGYDVVFLAAAKIYGVGGFNHYCADIISDDTAIQGNILKSCALHGVKRVVYISSSMVYETCVQDVNQPVTEDMVEDCPMPKTEYGVSKLLGERMCKAFRKQYGIDYTIWRPFNIITPHETSMSEQGFSHVFADYITNIVEKKLNPLPIIGDGHQIRCFTWIEDIANIIAEYSFSDATRNQSYNICNVEPISMIDLANKIHATLGTDQELRFQTVKNYANDVRVRIPSIDKLRTIIGNYDFQCVDASVKKCVNT
jgi:nucleoside-diphosphate-sugar epimerase